MFAISRPMVNARGFLILGLLIAFGSPPESAVALSLATLKTDARRLALDEGATRQRFSSEQIGAWIHEAQEIAIEESRAILKSSQFELVSGTTYYDMPDDFMAMDRLTHDNETLYEVTPEALDRTSRWIETGAEPTNYYINFASRTMVAFYPWPDSSSSTGTIRYSYWAQAADQADDETDEDFIPYNGITELLPYHYGLSYYAAARMAIIDGRMDLANIYTAQWRASVEALKRSAKQRPSYRPGAIGGRQ